MSNPKRNLRIGFFVVGCLIAAAGNWPVLAMANRVQPTIFGAPFMFTFVGAFVPILICFLYIAYNLGI